MCPQEVVYLMFISALIITVPNGKQPGWPLAGGELRLILIQELLLRHQKESLTDEAQKCAK